MSSESGPREIAAAEPLPLWLAAFLIQGGSFVMAIGTGVIVISLAYGSRTLLLGLALLSIGYVAIGLPGWYVARWRHHRNRLQHWFAGLPWVR